jgi:hypothetical protein
MILCGALSAFAAAGASGQDRRGSRIEQDDPHVTYSGNWYVNDSARHSGGVAALTNTAGARVTLSFTGTGITWIGVMDGYSGLATVYVDGTMKVVDSYADPARYQHGVYAIHGLADRTHTLTIEVTHERMGRTEGSWVWIDAFEIQNGQPVSGGVTASIGRIEENDPAMSFFGRWYANSNPEHSAGGAMLATDAGSRATLTFSGTGIRWMAYRDEWSGIARVYLDGELKITIDNYLSPAQARAMPYSLIGLPAGTHTLSIEATGIRNASSKGSWVWLDAFEVLTP